MLVVFNACSGLADGRDEPRHERHQRVVHPQAAARPARRAAFRVLAVKSDDVYLAYVLQVHSSDVVRYQPDFAWDGVSSGRPAPLPDP
jgi:hypothetical protein